MRLDTQVLHLSAYLPIADRTESSISNLEYEAEINQRAGKAIESLSEMAILANQIKQGKKPIVKYGPFIYAAMLSEFKNSARGQKLIRLNPELMPRLYESYKIYLNYTLGKD